jgi:hypothetical protein
MNGWKKYSAYLRRRIGRIKQWHLGLVFAVLLVAAFLGLRQNNLNMIELRNQVAAADEALDWGRVNSSAETLHQYVSRHMNANTGQIALQNLYNADVEKAFATANAEIDSSAYQAATASCQALISQSGYQGYANCVASSVGLSDEQVRQPEPPNAALYYISFLSPRLSFDLAGVCLVLLIVVFLTFSIRLLTAVALGVATRKKVKL